MSDWMAWRTVGFQNNEKVLLRSKLEGTNGLLVQYKLFWAILPEDKLKDKTKEAQFH
jgi:hypothetical protein